MKKIVEIQILNVCIKPGEVWKDGFKTIETDSIYELYIHKNIDKWLKGCKERYVTSEAENILAKEQGFEDDPCFFEAIEEDDFLTERFEAIKAELISKPNMYFLKPVIKTLSGVMKDYTEVDNNYVEGGFTYGHWVESDVEPPICEGLNLILE